MKKAVFICFLLAFILSGSICATKTVTCVAKTSNAKGMDIKISSDGQKAVDEVNDTLYTVIEGIGYILYLIGIWEYGVGMTSDEARQVGKGISVLACACALANIKTIMNLV